ncbi:MAG: RNA methyltransferase [Hyphomicrobiales bacterium]|nr:RNA methyltransferase [Hyphomicrobiales bacterium]
MPRSDKSPGNDGTIAGARSGIRKAAPDRRSSSHAGTGSEGVILYGTHAAAEALQNPERKVRAAYLSENMAGAFSPLCEARGLTPQIEPVKRIAIHAPPGAVHQGVVLVAEPLTPVGLQDAGITGPFVLLDRVTDPHNIGAIIRSAAAFNVSALVTTKRFSPEATGVLAKTASGGLEHVPWARETNLVQAMNTLKARGVTLIGLDGGAETPLHEIDATGPFGLVLGAEDKGLRQKTATHCDMLARLALPGPIRSLNVSNAAAIALALMCFNAAGAR